MVEVTYQVLKGLQAEMITVEQIHESSKVLKDPRDKDGEKDENKDVEMATDGEKDGEKDGESDEAKRARLE